MKTLHNERLKISATFLNGIAMAILAITPVGGLILGLTVFLVARRAARRDLDTSNPRPVPHTRT